MLCENRSISLDVPEKAIVCVGHPEELESTSEPVVSAGMRLKVDFRPIEGRDGSLGHRAREGTGPE